MPMLSTHCPAPTTSFALAAMTVLFAACPGDDGSADTETTAGSSTGGSSTDGGSGPDLDTTAGSESSSSSTTAVADDTSTSTTDDTTGDPPLDGVCEALDLFGTIATVLARDGMPIDTSCDTTPMPCGGDPVGTWTLEATCGYEAFPNPLAETCPGSTFLLEVLGQSGTLTLEADGSFVQDFDIQIQGVATLDSMACFGVDCSTFEMMAQGDNPGTTCQAMGPTCECILPDDGVPEQAMGTWELLGGGTTLFLTTLEPRVAVTSYEFCIAGDRLDLWRPFVELTVTEVACADDQDCIDALGEMHDSYNCE